MGEGFLSEPPWGRKDLVAPRVGLGSIEPIVATREDNDDDIALKKMKKNKKLPIKISPERQGNAPEF